MVFGLRILPVLFAAGAAMASDVRIVEQIVAKINGDIITSSELARGRKQLEAELRRRGMTGARLQNELKEQEKDLLRDRIDNLLFVQKAKELDLKVDSEVTKQLAELQRQNMIADQDKFHDWIREQYGMPFEDFRQEMRNGIMTRRLLEQEVGSKISVPRAEIEKYYEEHKDAFVREERVFLSEILLSTAGRDEKQIAAQEKKAKDLVERARQGEKFASLAKDNSDSQSASDGGQLPPMPRKDLLPQIADVVFNQERNFVSDPIRLPSGFMILRVDEKHRAGLASLEEVENEITQELFQPRFVPAVRTYLTKLRQDAFLEIREGYFDSAAAPGKDTRWQGAAQLKPETVTKEEVASRIRRKRLLWLAPIPLTKTAVRARSSSR
jgi:peptidyl-prolyl cis-trans isomerase SurA